MDVSAVESSTATRRLTKAEGESLVSAIRAENVGGDRSKIPTQTFADFHMAVYALQSLEINKRDEGLNWREDSQDNKRLKAGYDLLPDLELGIRRDMMVISRASCHTMAIEMTGSQTSYKEDIPKMESLISGELKEVVEEYRQYCAERNIEPGIFVDEHGRIPAPFVWKIKNLDEKIDRAFESKNQAEFKKLVGEMARIGTLLLDPGGNWLTLAAPLLKYSESGSLSQEITWIDSVINAQHKGGPMLERIALNFQNATDFLNAKKDGNDWVVGLAAGGDLLKRVRRYKDVIPLEKFDEPLL